MPATFKKAVVSKVNVDNYTADVYFAENPQTVIRSIAVARTVDLTKVRPGDRCKVDLFDETNPNDQILAYTY